jgi:hypothetical protein
MALEQWEEDILARHQSMKPSQHCAPLGQQCVDE